MTLNKVPVIGVIYNPLLDELYSACQGQGAYMNGQRLPLFNPPPTLDDISECLIATEAGSDRSKQVIDAKISAIHEMVRSKADSKTAAQAHSVRTTGSAALNLCSVAKGVVDVYWEVGCWEWDVAAGVVIVTESGGLVLSGSHDKSDFEPVNLFCRKYLAVRAADRKKQEHVVTQMREIIPAIDAPRAPVPGGFDA